MSLLGRQRELSEIEAHLEGGARLVTVTGAPGVGKSCVVFEVGRRHAGTLICDLATCRIAADVERSLRAALGSVSRSRFNRALSSFQGLVVLDRFEHLVECAADLVGSWTAGRGPRFLISSRERLGLGVETVVTLDPLDDESAVALYAARARRNIDRPLALSIVRKLDRLPLAIELAAARASLLSERELLERLDLGMNAIDSASKLRATVLWSLALLSPRERSTLLHCSVFRGAFDGRAAEAVVEAALPSSDTVANLVSLERKNLVRRAGQVSDARIALYDTVREVSLDELTREGQLENATLRHANYFRKLGNEALETHDAQATLALLREGDGLFRAQRFIRDRDPRGAAELALAIDLAHGAQAPSNAHLELLGSAMLSAELAGDDRLRSKVLHARARAHRLLGGTRRASRDLRGALELARRARAPEVESDVLRMLGVVARQRSQPLRAGILLRSALEIYERLENHRGVAMVSDDLGVVAHDRGELAAAREYYERALSLERLAGDRRFEGITLGHLGLVAHDLGDLDQAQELYREALVCHRESADPRFEGFAHAFVAALELERLHFEGARKAIDAAASIDARLGEVDSGALLAGLACALAAATGQIVRGREILARAHLDLAERDDTALRRMLSVFGAALEIAEARRARVEGRVDDVSRHLERAESALASEPRCVEESIARRVVTRLSEVDFGSRAIAVIASDGSWFETRHGRVSVATRRALALMLARLAAEHRSSPGRGVSLSALFDAGWPGDRINDASARRRVYVGIDTLRSLGLRTALVQRERGYFLDPNVKVHDGL